MKRRLAAAALLLAVAAAALPGHGAREFIRLEDGTRLQVEEFRGASRLAALKHLWERAEVVVECSHGKDFAVYTGGSITEVQAAYAAKHTAWCGWDHLLGTSSSCATPISPFGTTIVAVAKPRGWFEFGDSAAGTLGGTGSPGACTMARRATLSMPRLLLSVLGTFLFLNAPALSTSTPFRLTGGTLGFVALSSVVLLFILYRKMPHKRTVVVGTVVCGSSFLATLRYLFGTWLPSWSQVARSPVFLGYILVSGLTGLALTYWYNNPNNAKVNTMLNVALHLVGLGMAAAGPSLPEASALWALGLLGLRGWSLVARYRTVKGVFRQAKRTAQQMAAPTEEWEEAAAAPAAARAAPAGPPAAPQPPAPAPGKRRFWDFGRGVPTAAAAAPSPPAPAAYTPVVVTARGGPAGQYLAGVEGGTPAAAAPALQEPEVSPLVQRGMVLNEETGHLIHIGKATYNRLVGSGYVVDRAKGVITPPPPAPGSPPATSPRSSGRSGARRRRAS